eukprot:snap_masked-scaffold_59-processed-gene-0.88-mRNA-1 protein AED:1.00 eAED:1.00 QI:0/0/0/0/1/1/2/0/154
MHESLSSKINLNVPVVVHDWNNLDHMKARLRMMAKVLKKEREVDSIVELEMLRTRVLDQMKQSSLITEDMEKLHRIYELIRMGQIVMENMTCRVPGIKIGGGVCNNAIILETRRVRVYRCTISADSVSIKRDMFELLNDYKGAAFDVIMLDPPH